MSISRTIKIATDFSVTPGARYRTDGKFSGEEFRESILEPAFVKAVKEDCTLIVDLDGVAGYATSFLEESFGGLARRHEIKSVLRRIKIVSNEEPDWGAKIESYIKKSRDPNGED